MATRRRTTFAALTAALALCATSACGTQGGDASAASSDGSTSVSVRLKWLHQSQFAGFYAADAQDYYAEEGLDVEFQPGGPDAPAIQLVSSGSATYGIAGADQLLLAREKGIDVVAVAAVYRQTPFVLMTREDADLTEMEDLAGTQVGVKFGQSEEVSYRAMLEAAGMSTPEEVAVKFDLGPFLNGSLDAFPGYSINEAIAAEEEGVPVNLITPASVGIHMYADTLFTTREHLEEDPEEVRAFVAATLKGWDWAVANPDEAAALALDHDANLELEHEKAMMHSSIPSITPDDKPIGYMDAAEWTVLHDLLLDQGLLSEPQDVEDAFTSQFVADE